MTSLPRVETAAENLRPTAKRHAQECLPVSSREAPDHRRPDETRGGPVIALFVEPSAMPVLLSKVTESGCPKDSSNTLRKMK